MTILRSSARSWRCAAEQARLLGYDNFAAYRLDDSMAKTADAVERLLLQVWEPAKRKARAERAKLEKRRARRRIERGDRAVGLALLRREGAASRIRPRRGRGEAVLRPRQHGCTRRSTRPAACSASASPSAAMCPSTIRMCGSGRYATAQVNMSACFCTTISRAPASSRAHGRAVTVIRRPGWRRSPRSSSTTTISRKALRPC